MTGESELHIEKLRQKLAKDRSFESYNIFRLIGGSDSKKAYMGIKYEDIF